MYVVGSGVLQEQQAKLLYTFFINFYYRQLEAKYCHLLVGTQHGAQFALGSLSNLYKLATLNSQLRRGET